MTEKEISTRVRLSCQRAILGIITPNIRMLTIGWEGLKLFHLIAYYAAELSDDELDDINSVSAEIIADIPFANDKIECIVSTIARKDLLVLKEIVFARKE